MELDESIQVFMQVLRERRDLPICGMGDHGEAAGEKRKMKGYRLSQARLGFLPSQKAVRENTLRTHANMALLWTCAFLKTSALLMVPL